MEKKKKKKGKALSRRDFMKGFGSGAIGAAVVPRLFSQEQSLSQSRGKLPLIVRKKITFSVNQKQYSLEVEPRETLLDILRERLNLTGTKKICARGECGGCTVLLEGNPIYSCLFLAVKADGKNITTIEGLAGKDRLHPVQQAFIEHDGYQCGFCSPGFILSSVALLEKNSNPSLEEVKQGLSGNLCRCGNYFKIYKAVSAAAQSMRRS